jgi:hypothetical protein
MQDLIPICKVLKEIMTIVFKVELAITHHSHSQAFTGTVGTAPHIIPQSTVYEDNAACLKFACMPKLTLCKKHISIPYQWFHTQVEHMEIDIESTIINLIFFFFSLSLFCRLSQETSTSTFPTQLRLQREAAYCNFLDDWEKGVNKRTNNCGEHPVRECDVIAHLDTVLTLTKSRR